MEQKYLTELHSERMIWVNKLKFYRDDLKVMKTRLEEVVARNNHPEFLKMVEHFQNQFLIQDEAIDKLKHVIRQEEKKMVDAINANPTASDHRKADDDKAHRTQVESAERIFNELRHDFISFLTKYM